MSNRTSPSYEESAAQSALLNRLGYVSAQRVQVDIHSDPDRSSNNASPLGAVSLNPRVDSPLTLDDLPSFRDLIPELARAEPAERERLLQGMDDQLNAWTRQRDVAREASRRTFEGRAVERADENARLRENLALAERRAERAETRIRNSQRGRFRSRDLTPVDFVSNERSSSEDEPRVPMRGRARGREAPP